jgi:hypothetical protein
VKNSSITSVHQGCTWSLSDFPPLESAHFNFPFHNNVSCYSEGK